MGKPPDPEEVKAIKAAKKAEFAKQIFPIGDKWRVRRFDDLNWTIEHLRDGIWSPPAGHNTVYYGTLKGAFQDVPNFVVNAEAAGDIRELIDLLWVIRGEIDKALP
jgi:hypothetical protein